MARYEEGYLNPDVAKRVMLVKQQFKAERAKVAAEQNRKSQVSEDEEEEFDVGQTTLQKEGFDFGVEQRLVNAKGESINKVSAHMTNLLGVMQ